MNASLLETAESVYITPEFQKLLDQIHLSKNDIEEVLLNFPIVKKVDVSFSDKHERFYAEGMTDMGKKIQLIFYIHSHEMYPTFIRLV